MKILLCHNNLMRWADTFRAEVFKREWKDDEVDIVSALEPLPEKEYDVIHFLFSGGLSKHKDFILRHADKVFTSLASERTFKSSHNNQNDLKEIYENTKCCVCQNPSLIEKLKQFAPKAKSVYISNGVDTELFKPRPFTAGFVGAKGSYEHKGYYLAKQACNELGIELKVAHEHTYTHEDMPEFYKQIDCLLIPSLSEGCNNPTLEALSMNIPVISTDVGIAKILGCVIIKRDVDSLKTALLNLNRRFLILEKYDYKSIAKRYKELYKNYVEKQRNTGVL